MPATLFPLQEITININKVWTVLVYGRAGAAAAVVVLLCHRYRPYSFSHFKFRPFFVE